MRPRSHEGQGAPADSIFPGLRLRRHGIHALLHGVQQPIAHTIFLHNPCNANGACAPLVFEATLSLARNHVLSSSPLDMQTGAPRCFALDHMADIALSNHHRLHICWPQFVARVMDMSNAPSTATRAAAMAALRRATLGLLATAVATADAEEAGDGRESLECRVLSTVAHVFGAPGAHADVRFSGLDIIHAVLQVRALLLRSRVLSHGAV